MNKLRVFLKRRWRPLNMLNVSIKCEHSTRHKTSNQEILSLFLYWFFCKCPSGPGLLPEFLFISEFCWETFHQTGHTQYLLMIIIRKVRTAVKDAKIFLGFSKISSTLPNFRAKENFRVEFISWKVAENVIQAFFSTFLQKLKCQKTSIFALRVKTQANFCPKTQIGGSFSW